MSEQLKGCLCKAEAPDDCICGEILIETQRGWIRILEKAGDDVVVPSSALIVGIPEAEQTLSELNARRSLNVQ